MHQDKGVTVTQSRRPAFSLVLVPCSHTGGFNSLDWLSSCLGSKLGWATLETIQLQPKSIQICYLGPLSYFILVCLCSRSNKLAVCSKMQFQQQHKKYILRLRPSYSTKFWPWTVGSLVCKPAGRAVLCKFTAHRVSRLHKFKWGMVLMNCGSKNINKYPWPHV